VANGWAAIDASFSPKSGRSGYGLDWFWNGSQGQAERGLEILLLALVDVTHNSAYTLKAYQTPTLPKAPKVPKEAKDLPRKFADKVCFDDLSGFELAGEIDGQCV